MASWLGFFQAAVGASATLSGMLVVAISINLSRILDIPHLPDRAAAALIPPAGALLISMLALVPGQPPALFGAEVLAGGAAMSGLAILMLVRSRQQVKGEMRWLRSQIALGQAPSLPFVVAGAIMVTGNPNGLYWAAPGVGLALLSGIINTWVLLVEILR
jgi:hypothetical protein